MTVETETKWKLDPIQRAMGQLGWWQIIIFSVICVLKFPVAWHQMSIIFLGPKVEYTCANTTIPKCSEACTSWTFDESIFTETIISEWDLVCAKSNLANLSQTVFMFGILIGNIVFGTLADKYGRRPPLVFAVILQLISGVATAFVPWFWAFVVLRFITAIATGGTMVTSFVIVMEIIGPKWRELISVLYQIPFNLGHLTLAGFGYFFRDWRHLQFALSIPSLLLISYYWLVPESPRYLFTSGDTEKAIVILEKAAKRNKLPTDTVRADIEAFKKTKTDNGPMSKGNIKDLFRTPNMRAKTIYICFNWMVCGLAFFGVAQYVGHAGEGADIFKNVAIGAAMELPGTIFGVYTMKAYGRRKTLIGSNTLAGISMLLIAVIPQDAATIKVMLASIALVGMSISFPTVYLYAGELFPTVVRNVGVGTASMIARIGSMVAPFVANMGFIAFWLPPLIFGIIPLIGAGLTFFLPETQGFPLPETLEDGENFGKKTKKSEKTDAGLENGAYC